MAPLSFSTASTLHTLIVTRASKSCDQPDSSLCKSATPKSTIIIASVFGCVIFLTLLFAMWYWGYLCCLSRKRYRRVNGKDEQNPGAADVVAIGAIESASHVGNKGGGTKTQALSGSGHTGGGLSSAFGGGGVGSSWDCNVM